MTQDQKANPLDQDFLKLDKDTRRKIIDKYGETFKHKKNFTNYRSAIRHFLKAEGDKKVKPFTEELYKRQIEHDFNLWYLWYKKLKS